MNSSVKHEMNYLKLMYKFELTKLKHALERKLESKCDQLYLHSSICSGELFHRKI